MPVAPAPAKPKPPPSPTARPSSASPASTPASNAIFAVSTGQKLAVQKTVIFGPGSVGKTKLASLLSAVGFRPLVIDLETGSYALDVSRVDSIEDWANLRACLNPNNPLLTDFDTIIIDSLTRAEEMAVAWTIANVRNDKGNLVTSVEGYGWGRGYTHVYETFLNLLGDLDTLARRGKQIVCICHETIAKVPNPEGEDWSRYEPRLQQVEKGPIRSRVKEWADHLLFLAFDVSVTKDAKGKGKAEGSGTRTIYTSERPTWWAKSRTLNGEPVVYQDGSPLIWQKIFNKE